VGENVAVALSTLIGSGPLPWWSENHWSGHRSAQLEWWALSRAKEWACSMPQWTA